MAILPTKPLKRGSIYLLGIATCVLLFQIYRDRAGNKQNQPPGGYSFASQPHEFTSHVQTSRDNGGKVSKNPRGLVVGSGDSDKEIKALRMRLKDREDLVRRLREELESVKADREKLRRGIENLKETTATLPSTLAQQPRAVTEKPPLQGNEMEMSKKIPFLTITKTHVYETELHPKPKEYIFHGQRKGSRAVKQGQRHILAAQAAALDVLNLNSSFKLSLDHVVEGVFRVDHNTGMEYELSFRYPRTDRYAVVHLRRALGPLELASPAANNITASELINLILPLSGRLERFQKFLDMFIDVCVQKDKNVFLTVVLYGAKDFKTVRDILENLEKTYNFRKYQLIVRDKPFSRGRTLHDGVMYWTASENVLMFFCDVDVTFSTEFLRRCRTYTKPGKSVYYPIVFSLYNPKNVYEDGNIPSFEEQLKIAKPYGFWRTYGFGMTCQYRADYLRAGGFDLSIEGWGKEDQQLYQQHLVQPHMRIIRAPDRDLFHYYHSKYCDPGLKWEQYRSCLGSKATAEGTLTQIATQLMQLREKYEPHHEEDQAPA